MKKLTTAIIALILLNICIYAQYNYNTAVKECIECNGSDQEIVNVMYKHGFITDGYSQRNPGLWKKVIALFININID